MTIEYHVGKMQSPGQRIYNLAEKLFPICRSITGVGVRESLGILSDYIGKIEGGGYLKSTMYHQEHRFLIGQFLKNG